jgi:hypothetical protein
MTFAGDFLHSKVTWTGIGAIAYVLVRLYLRKVELDEAVLSIFTALGVIFGRDSMVKANLLTAATVAAVNGSKPDVVVVETKTDG